MRLFIWLVFSSNICAIQFRLTNNIHLLPVPERKITISDDVKDTFSESSFHQDLVNYWKQASEDEETTSENVIAVRIHQISRPNYDL